MAVIGEDGVFVDAGVANEMRKTGVAGEAVKTDRAALKAGELGLIRTRLGSTAAGHVTRAADKLIAAGTSPMSNADYEAFNRSVTHAARAAQLDGVLAELEERFATSGGMRITEPRVYGPDSPHSYFRDLAAGFEMGAGSFGDISGAQQRMARYDVELAYEVRRGSPEGKRVERAIAESCRSEQESINREIVERRFAELRALTTGGGSTASAAGAGGAALVSPYFIWEAWAPFRGVHRTFADQCDTATLPPWGMELYLPAFTSTTGTGQQTEGQAVAETDPSTGLQGAQIQTVTGQITMTQLSDRGFTGGGTFDKALGKQLQQQLDQSVEQYVIAQALAGAATVSGQASFSIAGLYQDIAAGREKLTDTAGTRLRPTHLFTTSDFYSYVTRQVDTSQRPIVVPMFAPGFPLAAGDEQTKWSRFTGTVLPGGVLWFEADAIPNLGTTSETQLLVSAPDEAMVLAEGEPILAAYPQANATTLEIVLNLRAYVAAIPRYPSGTASITSAAYTSALV